MKENKLQTITNLFESNAIRSIWDAEKEEWRYSHGVKATMPMYNAYIQMLQQIKTIAREVFGK